MKRAVGVMLIMAALVSAFGCSGDIILQEPPPLNGDYTGFYVLVTPTERDSQPITFTFGDENYLMKLDTTSAHFGAHSFCNVSGKYSLTEGVRLEEKTSVPLGGFCRGNTFDACTEDEDPKGLFTLIRSDAGKHLQLKQQTNDTLSKQLILDRVIADSTGTD